MRLVALAGGVGAARFLSGMVQVADPRDLTVIANTGDDLVLHGLHVSPDLDTITYTLGGGVDREQGWGRAGDTFAVIDELDSRYGVERWFSLGDRDIATHLLRTQRLAAGATLAEVTAEIAEAWSLPFRLLPMTNDAVGTVVTTAEDRDLGFQQWWVGERAKPDVVAVRLAGADRARPAPGVLEAIDDAELVILCPSNPVVSIGTILAVPGIRDSLLAKHVVGVSPIVGGRVVRGMADRLLPAFGVETSAAGVVRLYADFLDGWVIDRLDAELNDEIEAMGVAVAVTDTVMGTTDLAAALARTVLDLGSR